MEAVETPPKLISFTQLIEMLRTRNPEHNRLAAATLIQAGQPILSRLVAHAADPSKTATHRVRLLNIIQGIGYPSNPMERLTLFRMTYNAPPSVRQAAGRLIKHLRFDAPQTVSATVQPKQSVVPESVLNVEKSRESPKEC